MDSKELETIRKKENLGFPTDNQLINRQITGKKGASADGGRLRPAAECEGRAGEGAMLL